MKLSQLLATATLGLTLFATACGGDTAAKASPASGSGAQAAAEPSVAPTGVVHEVKMISGNGERFEPAELTVQAGDVVRFVLVAGVHNASFPAAKNPSGVTLPPATPYLQAPGQTHDLVIDLPPGEYHFQCDPHVALGMVGTLTVTD